MTRVVESAFLPYPPEVVFRTACDPQKQLHWDRTSLRSIERLSAVPLGVGARCRGDFKGAGSVEFDFVGFDPPHRYTHLTTIPFGPMRHAFTFEPEQGGTRPRQEAQLELAPLARPAAPLCAFMLRRRFRHLAEAVRRDRDESVTPSSAEGGAGS
jgi:hypothetical protein